MNHDRLKKRAEGRRKAREILELVEISDQQEIDAFLDEMKTKLLPEATADEQKKSKKRLLELAEHKFDFGKFANIPICRVPRDYLHWLAGSMEESLTTLNEFLEATKHEDDE